MVADPEPDPLSESALPDRASRLRLAASRQDHDRQLHRSAYLDGYPYFVKWLLSVSEYRAFGYRSALYTIAQGDVPHDAMSFRMGGYLFIYVFVSLVMFVYLALQAASPQGLLGSWRGARADGRGRMHPVIA